jgi:hypothetical protein
MDGYRRRLWFLVMVILFGAGGASCPHGRPPWQPEPAVRVLPPAPTLDQVIEVVNRNSSQIRSISTTQASMSGTGFPTLRANLAFERPRNFRLVAETGLTGPELDIGSNDELFWFWVRRAELPGVYFCRHDEFPTCPMRHLVPIEPEWLIEALGIAELDPALPHQGPTPLPGDRFEIRTIRETLQGPMTKATVIDGLRGWIVEQRLYDAEGRLVASATASRHGADPLNGLVVPGVVEIDCPAARLAMRIDLGNARVNRLSGDPGQLWAMPSYAGAPPIDLCGPGVSPPGTAPAAGSAAMRRAAPPATSPAAAFAPRPASRRSYNAW